jgi:hypothetical protein
MILDGLLFMHADAVSIAAMTLGTVILVAGIIAPRLHGNFEMSHKGMKGSLASIDSLDGDAYLSTAPAIENQAELPTTNAEVQIIYRHPSPTIDQIIKAAMKQGWSMNDGHGHHIILNGPEGKRLILPNTSRRPSAALIQAAKGLGIEFNTEPPGSRQFTGQAE